MTISHLAAFTIEISHPFFAHILVCRSFLNLTIHCLSNSLQMICRILKTVCCGVIELLTDIAEHLPSPLALVIGFLNEINNTLLMDILLGLSYFLLSMQDSSVGHLQGLRLLWWHSLKHQSCSLHQLHIVHASGHLSASTAWSEIGPILQSLTLSL